MSKKLAQQIYNYLDSEAAKQNWFLTYAQIRVKFDKKSDDEIKAAIDKLIKSGKVFDGEKIHNQPNTYTVIPF